MKADRTAWRKVFHTKAQMTKSSFQSAVGGARTPVRGGSGAEEAGMGRAGFFVLLSTIGSGLPSSRPSRLRILRPSLPGSLNQPR